MEAFNTEDRAGRIDAIVRMSKARTQLQRVLMRVFTTDELGLLFDALPVDNTQPMVTLAEAVGRAWADSREAGHGKAVVDDPEDPAAEA